jgi:hypothetical protein
MRISDFRHESIGNAVQLSATVAWEDSDLPAEKLCFEVEGVASGEVVPSPEAFAIQGALAAFHQNEKRVLVESSLCPRLRDGLRTALRTLRAWYSPDLEEPILEASRGFRALRPPEPQAALFLSGGADSLFVLQSNRANFPADHPSSFRTAIFVPNFGALLEAVSSPRAIDLLSRQRSSVARIARLTGLQLVSAWACSGELEEDASYTSTSSHGARLAATAHLFPALTSISIAASFDASQLHPWGSHPLLDPNYSSSALEVRHEGIWFTRLERVASVAKWKEILPHLIVCGQGPLASENANCGRCEKCVRTMIELLLADSLSEDGPFRVRDVDPSLIDPVLVSPASICHWEAFPALLRKRGRTELSARAELTLSAARRRRNWFDDQGWKGRLRRLDRRLLGGRLLEASRRIRKGRSAPVASA